jgi:hypothetical protein
MFQNGQSDHTNLLPVDNPEVPLLVADGNIASLEPALLIQTLLRSNLVPPIAHADIWSANVHFAWLAHLHLITVIVDQLALAVGIQLPNRATIILDTTRNMQRTASHLGHSPALIYLDVESSLAFVLKLA